MDSEFNRLKVKHWEDAPDEYNLWGGGKAVAINKGDLQHMMKGYLLNYSDDAEYGHYLKLAPGAIEWLRSLASRGGMNEKSKDHIPRSCDY